MIIDTDTVLSPELSYWVDRTQDLAYEYGSDSFAGNLLEVLEGVEADPTLNHRDRMLVAFTAGRIVEAPITSATGGQYV